MKRSGVGYRVGVGPGWRERESQGCSAGLGPPLESGMGYGVEPEVESGKGSRLGHGVMRYKSGNQESRVPGPSQKDCDSLFTLLLQSIMVASMMDSFSSWSQNLSAIDSRNQCE